MTEGLIAGIGLTHLQVYDQRPAPDGKLSGCAHVHALTDEAYYVIAGEGAVELHDLEHGFRTVPLEKGAYVSYPPLTLHRTISTGGLEILAIMGNAGLPERGDARIYFGPEADADPELYERYRSLADRGLEGALERRDHSVRAYMKLVELWDSDQDAYRSELARFLACHQEAMANRRADLEDAAREGPARLSQIAARRLESLPETVGGEPALHIRSPVGQVRYGMCGILRQLETPVAV